MGYSPWGLEESNRTERLYFRFSLSCIGEGNMIPTNLLLFFGCTLWHVGILVPRPGIKLVPPVLGV